MTRRAGYSLFEVLIAFAVMTMVLTALLPRQAGLFSRVAQVDERQLAQDFAYSRLDRLGVSDPLQPGITVQAYRDWRLTQTVTETVLPGASEITAVRILIEIASRSGARLARAETLRAVP